MKINSSTLQFKGYDAAPLKAIWYEKTPSYQVIDEQMKAISQKEGFEIKTTESDIKWSQDYYTVIESDKRPLILAKDLMVTTKFADKMREKYKIDCLYSNRYATGGNSFIGKTSDGQKWLMIGEDELRSKDSKANFAKDYDVRMENIFVIPQQNFHLDMFLRPLGFPFVLVDNPSLTSKKISQLDKKGHLDEFITLQKDFKDYEANRQRHFASHKDVIKALKKYGFIPIEIAGVYGANINFMNAIVNQRQNGTLSYITNSTVCDNPFISKIQDEFSADLLKKVPFCQKTYFVSGAIQEDGQNYLMHQLGVHNGGLHCMPIEEPNFEIWG